MIKNNIRLIIFIAVVLVIAILMVIPVDVPFAIKEPGKIVPVKEWTVEKNSAGGITFTLYDHKSGTVEMNSIDIKNAGGSFKFSTTAASKHSELVKQGDTLGFIQVMPMQKTEGTEMKPIMSPISGVLSDQLSDSVFLSVRDISEYLVIIPVKPRDKKYINTGQTILVKVPGTKDRYEGKIFKIDDTFRIIKGNQYAVTVGVINMMTKDLQPGMVARCSIECSPVRMREYIGRTLDLGINEE